MNPDTGLLTTLLNIFVSAFSGGFSKIYPDAMSLLAILSVLEIALAAVWWSITEDNSMVIFLKKCIQIGFFVFVITKYQLLVKVILDGFTTTGLKAGGGSMSLIRDPSSIIDFGFSVTDPIFQKLQYISGMDVVKNLPHLVMAGIAGLLILLSFFAIGIQVFVTYTEFYLIAVLGLILVPFGVFKHTAFITEKVFGAIISFGVRLMVLAFILAVASPVMGKLALSADPKISEAMMVLLAALTIMCLSWHAPSIASGLISGAPSLTAGAAVGMGAAAAGGIAGAGLAASAGAKTIGRVGISATKAAATMAGAVTMSAKIGSSEAGARGISQTAGAIRGVGGLAIDTAKSAYSSATSVVKESFQEGQMRAYTPAGKTTNDVSGTPPGTGHSAGSAIPAWANKVQQARSVIPPDSQPQSGIRVPINHEK